MNKIMLPCAYGVSIISGGYKNSCIINKNGKIQIIKQKCSKINKNYDIFLIRGLIFAFFGVFHTVMGLFEFANIYQKEENVSLKKTKNSLNISSQSIIFFVVLILGIVISFLLLGVLPIKLSFYLTPKNFDMFLKRLIIGIVKCLIIYVSLLLVKFLSPFMQYYKFNSAIKEYQEKNGTINFLLYFICSVFLTTLTLSVVGLSSNLWYSIFVNLFITICIFSVNYELVYELQKNKVLCKVFVPFNFLIYKKPSQKEIKCVNIVLKEIEQINGKKETMETKEQDAINFSEAYVNLKEKLEKANKYEKSDLDFIFCEILGKNRAELKLTKTISKSEYKKANKVVERRCQGEPITKIFEHANFYGLDFKVTKDVLSPRMETEILVEQVINECTPKSKVLDIGTGSGAIAITIAKLKNAKVVAVDISEKALAIAMQNAKQNGVSVNFKKADVMAGLKGFKKFDIIVSNPPYIPSADIEELDEEVKRFDPLLALDGGKSGLDFYEKIIEEAPKILNKNGKVFFEIGIGQAKDLKKLLQKNFKDIRIVKDYNKIERVVIATLV